MGNDGGLMDLPKTRAEAKARGLTRYFTGEPCGRGHVAERLTNSATCVVCHNQYNANHRAQNGDKIKQYMANYYADPENKSRHKQVMAEYYKENRDAYAGRNANWRAANPEKNRALARKWRRNNREKNLRLRAQWRDENREELNAKAAERRRLNPEAHKEARARYYKTAKGRAKDRADRKLRDARKLQAKPAWLTKEHLQQIKDICEQAVLVERLTGVKHHVDHIEPLRGKDRCGLHVPWNLQVLTAEENNSKGNRAMKKGGHL